MELWGANSVKGLWTGLSKLAGQKTAQIPITITELNARIRVLKSTYELPSGENFVPKGGWEPMWDDQIPLEKTLIDKDKMEQTGRIGPIIDENCHQYYSDVFFMKINGPQSMFCHELMKFLFENRVPDKRFCLYEMPETKGFLNKAKE